MTPRSNLRPALACLCCVLFLALSALVADEAAGDDSGGQCGGEYVQRPEASGAAQDVLDANSNFLECTSGQYALCYYSGADPLPCKKVNDSTSICTCQVFTATEEDPMYVDINSILDVCAYNEAIDQCGEDGSGCRNITPGSKDLDEAYVCGYIEAGTFNPAAAYISTFSYQQVSVPQTGQVFPNDPLGCVEAFGQYAGCMTASCQGGDRDGNGNTYTECACPLWPLKGSADYQYGRTCTDGAPSTDSGNCILADDQVWSAAWNSSGCS